MVAVAVVPGALFGTNMRVTKTWLPEIRSETDCVARVPGPEPGRTQVPEPPEIDI